MELTIDSVRDSLNRLLIERGEDFIYSPVNDECHYVHDTPDGWEPGCMWGWILADHGVPLDDLKALEGKSIAKVLRKLSLGTMHIGFAALSAQMVQDGEEFNGVIRPGTLGQAVDAFENSYAVVTECFK